MRSLPPAAAMWPRALRCNRRVPDKTPSVREWWPQRDRESRRSPDSVDRDAITQAQAVVSGIALIRAKRRVRRALEGRHVGIHAGNILDHRQLRLRQRQGACRFGDDPAGEDDTDPIRVGDDRDGMLGAGIFHSDTPCSPMVASVMARQGAWTACGHGFRADTGVRSRCRGSTGRDRGAEQQHLDLLPLTPQGGVGVPWRRWRSLGRSPCHRAGRL